MLVKDVVNDWLVSLIIDHRSHGGSEIVGAVWHFYPNKKVSACGNEVHPKTQPTGRWDDGAVCTICERLYGERRKPLWNPRRRDYVEMVHLAVQGPRNITTIGAPGELSNETLEAFAGMVRDRRPGKRYYIVTDTMPKQILYRWHVGEGFSHEEGWWIQ